VGAGVAVVVVDAGGGGAWVVVEVGGGAALLVVELGGGEVPVEPLVSPTVMSAEPELPNPSVETI
jgi:hypothetical protein